MTMKFGRLPFYLVLVALGLAAPAFAWDPSDSQVPGSVLVFPSVHTGTVLTPDRGVQPITTFEISALCPKDQDCSVLPIENGNPFGTVRLRAHYVCGGDAKGVCLETDFNLKTTVNGTLAFSAEDFPTPPNCPSNTLEEEAGGGYLIVWAVDVNGNAISFDGLIGDEVIRGSGSSARAHAAIPIQSVVSFLGPTDVNYDGRLDFDDNEYRTVTGKIHGSIPFEQGNRESSLILLTLDVRSNQPNPPTTAGLNFYNEKEQLLSSAATFTCWGELHLSDLPGGNNLTENAFGNKGLVTSDPAVQNGNLATMLAVFEREEEFASLPVTATGSQTVVIGGIMGIVFPCASLTFPAGCTCTPAGITCTVNVSTATTIPLTREYSYPLYNDGTPVNTTFEPKPLP
jgi:hypothetical protein